jgi:hypothetical protein
VAKKLVAAAGNLDPADGATSRAEGRKSPHFERNHPIQHRLEAIREDATGMLLARR